jgi:PTH2 family peptidyl-tRNA hydrolase
MGEPKQIIVMRADLKMSLGKSCAQAAHASVKVLLDNAKYLKDKKSAYFRWVHGSFAKVCVRVDSEAGLIKIVERARRAGLPVALINDAGRTEFEGVPTLTCCAIGPCFPQDIDPITGKLTLL